MATTTEPVRRMTNGAIPRVPVEGDTTRITCATLSTSGMTADQLIEALAAKIATRSPGDGSGGNGGGRKVLGIEVASIMKWLLTAICAAAVFVFTWYQAVNAGLKDRPTKAEVEAANTAIDAKVDAKISAVETEVQAVRESQIRTEEQIGSMGEMLREIRTTTRRR